MESSFYSMLRLMLATRVNSPQNLKTNFECLRASRNKTRNSRF